MISSTPEQIWIDIHCHLFNAHDLPVVDFVRETRSSWEAWLADITTRGAPTVDDDLRLIDALMRGELPTIPAHELPEAIDRTGPLAGTLRMRHAVTRSRVTSLKLLDSICSETDHAKLEPPVRELLTAGDVLAPVSLYVPLCVDMGPRIDRSLTRASPRRQFSVMTALSDASLFEDVIPGLAGIVLPMAGFHPERTDKDPRNSLAIVKCAVHEGAAIGVKIYPPMGFRPSGNGAPVQAVLDDLFRWADECDVPIVAHCSPANAIAGAEGNAHPENWRRVLDAHPGLRLCLAHAGGLDAPDWMYAAAQLVTEFPNVYCDVSNHDLVRRGARWPTCCDGSRVSRRLVASPTRRCSGATTGSCSNGAATRAFSPTTPSSTEPTSVRTTRRSRGRTPGRSWASTTRTTGTPDVSSTGSRP